MTTPLHKPTGARRHVLMGVAVLAVVGLGGAALADGTARAPAGRPTATPRLVVTPHTVALGARLSGGAHLSGTLVPALPGPNTIHMVVRDGAGRCVCDGRVHLVALMPGMRMRPRSVTLARHGDGYRGVVSLPMFGRYRTALVVATAHGQYRGTLTVALALPPWSGDSMGTTGTTTPRAR